MAHRIQALLQLSCLLLLPLVSLLVGCGAVITYAEVQQTAQAGGCWPNTPRYPTPAPVTITPALPLTATPAGYLRPTGMPSPTRLPTTTPYPRCAPAPGEVLVPWPTPVPAQPPYPTMADTRAGGSSGQKTTLQLPEIVLWADIAVHPTEGWPAVAAAVWSGNDNPERAFVSVLNPSTRTWTPAHQVDIGPSALGRYTRTVEVAITGDGVVHAVWGMSDPDFSDNDPPAGVWAAESRDYGRSWSTPQRIGSDCRQVNDLAASLDGWLVAGLICNDGPDRAEAAIATRSPDGVWTLERLPSPVWSFSAGAVALADDGNGVRATVFVLTSADGRMAGAPRVLRFSRPLDGTGPWERAAHDIDLPGVDEGQRTWHARAVVYRPANAATDAITLMFADASRWNVYALTSQDGGRSWLAPELAVAPEGGEQIAMAAPAYDPLGQRLVAIYTCCVAGGWDATLPSTHYLRWSRFGSRVWSETTPGQRVPLILGGRAVGTTVSAQGRNARTVWVAWVEGGNAVEVRSFDLASVLPTGSIQR